MLPYVKTLPKEGLEQTTRKGGTRNRYRHRKVIDNKTRHDGYDAYGSLDATIGVLGIPRLGSRGRTAIEKTEKPEREETGREKSKRRKKGRRRKKEERTKRNKEGTGRSTNEEQYKTLEGRDQATIMG